MKRLAAAMVLCVCALVPVSTVTDVWDIAGQGDDTPTATDNELVPGVSQQHDLQAVGGVADVDWYLLGQKPFSSYEIIVDGIGALAANPNANANGILDFNLVDSNGAVVVFSANMSAWGASRSLRRRNTTASEVTDDYVRVAAGPSGCGTACTSGATYRISMHETTMFAPRFNNTGSQITVLILQNATSQGFDYGARFFNPSGALLATSSGTLPARGGVVINTALLAGLAGTSGVISVEHNGPYSGLAGKAVALEPSTGFSFDTPLVPKLH